MNEQKKTCCFTGHRKLPANKIQNILINLDREIEALIASGITDFVSGGALGFDQTAASLILVKKETGKMFDWYLRYLVKTRRYCGMKNK